jgi:hypothetical protein
MVPVALIALVAVAGCDSGGALAARGSSSAKPSTVATPMRAHQAPSALLSNAIAAVLAQGSVHLACTAYASEADFTMSGDAGVVSGSESWASPEHGTVRAMVVDGVFYLRSSSKSDLVNDGFPQSVAAKMAGKWLSFQPGDSYGGYSVPSLASDLTLESVAGQLQLTGTLKSVPPKMIDGQMTVGVSGEMGPTYGAYAKGSLQTMYVRSTGDPLPVSFSYRNSVGRQTCDFSRWGEPVRLTAPPNAVPVTSLPSDGTSK